MKKNSRDKDEYSSSIATRNRVGFRFLPTDEELITNYLKPKILGTDSEVDNVIAEVDFYRFEPCDLPSKSKIKSQDQMWLFFYKRDYKYPSSKRSKRTTRTGFWKITGKERLTKNQETKEGIGKKRPLIITSLLEELCSVPFEEKAN